MRVVSWLVQKRADAMVRKGIRSASTVKLMRTNIALLHEKDGIGGMDIGALREQIAEELRRRGFAHRRTSHPTQSGSPSKS